MTLRARRLKALTWFYARFQDRAATLFGRARPGTLVHASLLRLARSLVGPLPLVVKLDVTSACNVRCRMCYARQGRAEEMPLERARELFRRFRGIPVRLDLMGGEPFMHAGLDRIVAAARAEARLGEIVVYTNATLVTPEAARAVRAAGLDRAMVNISSHDPRKHDAFTRVPGSWERTVAGIANLKSAGIDTAAFVVLHRENMGDYDRLRDFALERLRVRPLFFQYVPAHGMDELTPDPEAWADLKRRILYRDEPRHRRSITRINALCGKSCLGGYYSISVKVNGDLTPCPFIDDVVLGNIFRDDFWEIFAAGARARHQRAGVAGSAAWGDFMSIPAECAGCSHTALCGGGCRAGNRDADGRYRHRDFRCLGPWPAPIDPDALWDRLPTFF